MPVERIDQNAVGTQFSLMVIWEVRRNTGFSGDRRLRGKQAKILETRQKTEKERPRKNIVRRKCYGVEKDQRKGEKELRVRSEQEEKWKIKDK